MAIPQFSKYPSTLSPTTFASDMDTMISEFPAFIEALNAAADLYTLGLAGSSTSSVEIGTGVKTLTVQTGLGYVPGMDVVVAYTTTPTDRMLCTVRTYSISTGVLEVDSYSAVGTGTHTAWSVSMTSAVDATQFVTPTGTQTLTNKTITDPVIDAGEGSLIVPFKAAPDQTAEGSMQWDSDGEVLTVGTGSGRKTLMNSDDTTVAKLAGATFTGVVSGVTPTAGDNTTEFATTEFVNSAQAAGRTTLTASGAVTAGDVVVLNSDGTVSVVGSSLLGSSMASEEQHTGEETDYYNGKVVEITGTNKVAVIYTSGGAGKVNVGEIDTAGESITWGTPVAAPSPMTTFKGICWDQTASKLVIVGSNGSTSGYVVIGTVTGTDVSFGTEVNLGTIYVGNMFAVYNAHQGKVILSYKTTTAVAAFRVFSTTLNALGTPTSVNSTSIIYNVVEYSGTPYSIYTASTTETPKFRIGVVEINAITTNAKASVGVTDFLTSSTGLWVEYSAVSDRLVAFSRYTTFSLKYSVISMSGFTLTLGPVRVITAPYSILTGCYSISNGRIVVGGKEDSTNYFTVALYSIEGDTIVESERTYVNSSNTDTPICGYNSVSERVTFAYKDYGGGVYGGGYSRVWNPGDISTDANNWIGIAEADIADGATGSVTVKGGICQAVSDLTPGYNYYIDDYGDLQQTGSRHAGVALSATKLFLSGNA